MVGPGLPLHPGRATQTLHNACAIMLIIVAAIISRAGINTIVAASGAALALAVWLLQPPAGNMPALPGDVPATDAEVHLPTTGRTRYRLSPGAGRLVVLIHGISYPMDVYARLFDDLVQAGPRSWIFDRCNMSWTIADLTRASRTTAIKRSTSRFSCLLISAAQTI